jgi:hypothetical protein
VDVFDRQHDALPNLYLFSNGLKTQDTSTSGSASGIGDIVVRGKYLFTSTETSGIGLGLDLRLPSGDTDNMLGAGATQTQFYLIASGVRRKFGDHVNIAYTVPSDTAAVNNQFNYVGGAEYAVTPKLTVVGDLVGRTFIRSTNNPNKLTDTTFQHSFQDRSNTAPEQTVTLQTVALESDTINSVLGTAGFKYSAVGNLLVNAHIVVTVNDSGLHLGVTGVFGFDYSF